MFSFLISPTAAPRRAPAIAARRALKGVAFGLGLGVVALSTSASALCLDPPGDITGDGATNISDVQCAAVANLWTLMGSNPAMAPGCIGGNAARVDANCDGGIDVTDVQIIISNLLGKSLGALDSDSNGCVDACDGGTIEPSACCDAAPSTTSDLAVWTFETSQPTTAGPHTPEGGVNAAGAAGSGFHLSAATAFTTPAGNGSARAYSSNNWGIGDYWQFRVGSAGYTNLSVSFDQTRSATGPGEFNLQWSTDGTNYTTLSAYSVAAVGWTAGSAVANSTFTFNLPAAANGNTIWVRMTSTVATAAAGTNRIDNVIIRGLMGPAAGCADSAPCAACVCDIDATCCSTTWDSDCAALAQEPCMGACGCQN